MPETVCLWCWGVNTKTPKVFSYLRVGVQRHWTPKTHLHTRFWCLALRGVQQATAHKKCAHMGTFYMFSGSRCRRGSQGGTQHKNVPMQAHFVLGFKGGAEGGMGRHPDMKIVPPWAWFSYSGVGIDTPTSRTCKTCTCWHIEVLAAQVTVN